MIRVTVEVCPPEGERKKLHTIDIEMVAFGGLDSRRRYYSVRCDGRYLTGISDHVEHWEPDGALVLVKKALTRL